MPIFLDAHRGSELPLDSVRAFLRAARGTDTDTFGVRPLDLYCADDGWVFYVVAAPDEAAIRQRHAEQGVVCHRVRRVQPRGVMTDELGDAEKAIVRRMIVGQEAPLTGAGDSDFDEWLRQVG
jgi:hypothetical protein